MIHTQKSWKKLKLTVSKETAKRIKSLEAPVWNFVYFFDFPLWKELSTAIVNSR